MPAPPSRLDDALAAQRRLADAVDRVAEAKRDFHAAVCRLNQEGASLREIADALHLSHQRVHQIVGSRGSGRPWARLVPWRQRPRPSRAHLICSFCGTGEAEVGKLVAGPDVHICDRCATRANQVARGITAADSETPMQQVATAARLRCSFCGKRPDQVAWMVTSSGRAICRPCVDLCFEIMDMPNDDGG